VIDVSEQDDWAAPEVEGPDRSEASDPRTGERATQARMREQARWVDLQVQKAIERGEFDNLPGKGKPLPPLDNDPDWWLKKLIERERITGVLPEALQLRKDDAELEGELDRQSSERVVRELLETFNRRVVNARRQLQGGPPVITATRDVEAEIAAWRERRRRR
jgi:DnaJ-like protein